MISKIVNTLKKVNTLILNILIFPIGSQCIFRSTDVIYSNLRVCVLRLAVEFWMFWKWLMVDIGKPCGREFWLSSLDIMKACTSCLAASPMMYFRMSLIHFRCGKHERLILFVLSSKFMCWSSTTPKFLSLVPDETLSFPISMCVVVVVLRKYGEALRSNLICPSFICNLFLIIHIIISTMQDWTSFIH